jgi:hypothetical protein
MSQDIQIGGDVNLSAMGIVVVLAEATDTLTKEQIRDMERILSRCKRLLKDLVKFWERHPKLDKLADRAAIAAL